MTPPLHPPIDQPSVSADERFGGPDRWGDTREERPPASDVNQQIQAAVAHAYRMHSGLVFRLALRYGRGRPAFAEDITQDVFLQLWRCAGDLESLDAIEGWLYTTTTRRCLNKLRNERIAGLFTLRWLRADEPSIDADVVQGARDELRRAFDALATLPPKERVAFAMYHLDGKSQDEIGAVLGHSKSYVSKLITRATENLVRQGWGVSP